MKMNLADRDIDTHIVILHLKSDTVNLTVKTLEYI